MAFLKNIRIGEHYHRTLTESTVIEYNPTTKKIDTKLLPVNTDVIGRLRQRSRSNGGPNITVEAVVVHNTDVPGVKAGYKIITNRYGMSIVPWSLAAPEDLRRDSEITVFETVTPKKYLSIGQDKNNIVSIGYQEDIENSGLFMKDAEFPPMVDGVSSAIVNGVFMIFTSAEDYDIVLMFRNLEDVNPEEILEEFKAKRTFSI